MWPENVVCGHAAALGFARLEPRARSLIFRRRWFDRAAGSVDSRDGGAHTPSNARPTTAEA